MPAPAPRTIRLRAPPLAAGGLPWKVFLTGHGPRVAVIRRSSACERWEIRFRVEKGDIVASPRRLTHEKSLPDFEARVLAQVALLVLVHSVIVARCPMTCQTCGLEKPPDEVNDDDGRCDSCRGEITDVRRHAPPPASVYLKPDAIYHARCEQPLVLIRYVASAGELHFRCRFCGESVFLPEVAIERVERR